MSTPAFSQGNQELEIVEPTKSLLIGAIEGEENLSELFAYRLTLFSEKKSISPGDLLGKPVSVKIHEGRTRPIHGRVRRFTQGRRTGNLTEYHMEIVPWLWLLSLASDCRHWEDKTVIDITKDIFQRLGFRDYKMSCSKNYPAREFCVQYNETHLDFLSRLWEEEGIYYYFKHEESSHQLVLADDPTAVHAGPFVEKLQIGKDDGSAFASEDLAIDVRIEHNVHPQAYLIQDFDFEHPSAPLKAKVTSSAVAAVGERFQYAGPWMIPSFGDRMVRAQLEHEEARHTIVTGTTDSVFLVTGTSVELCDPPTDQSRMPVHIIGTRLTLKMATYTSGLSEQVWLQDFTAIPRDTPFRPPQKTPKPRMQGAQTAMVFTEKGEEITVDKYSRIRVKFHWDRTETKSCWVRLSSTWAGGGLGFVQLPRGGDEVVVDFLDGDPDRPIIVGRLYNAATMPPLSLPNDKSKSGLKSRSLEKGAAWNELWFDDTKDKEKVSLYAGKDYDTVVKNDCTRTVKEGKDDTTIEKGSQTITVKEGDQTTTLTKGSQKFVVHKERNVTIETGDDVVKVSQGNMQVELAQGNVTIKASAGKVSIEATTALELKVGASTVKLDQSGVQIAGTMVKVEGQATTQIKAPMTQVNGDGMLTLKGGVTMVN